MSAKHATYFNLLEGLKEGCPICLLMKKGTRKFMDDFLYESVNDPNLRREVKDSQGFCNRHAWQLQKFGEGFGQAIVYSDLMNMLLKRIEKIGRSLSIKEALKRISPAVSKQECCIFCKQEKDTEERYIAVFWENFDDPEFNINYKTSFGLCIPHIASALKKCKSKKFSKELIDIEKGKLSALLEESKEFMRKHDYRFSQERFGKEGDSWIRAIEKIIGKEGMY